mmetsp:Transcript_12030/g.27431  ORF Transcript_12030/g.27431 Transcript_12030/m.27431 type:complete len:339 (-) Transcript_12030:1634-2650(-)
MRLLPAPTRPQLLPLPPALLPSSHLPKHASMSLAVDQPYRPRRKASSTTIAPREETPRVPRRRVPGLRTPEQGQDRAGAAAARRLPPPASGRGHHNAIYERRAICRPRTKAGGRHASKRTRCRRWGGAKKSQKRQLRHAWPESESPRCDASPLSAPAAAAFRRSLLRRLAVCYAASELLRRHSALVADAAAACGTDNWSVVTDAGGEVRAAETRAPRRLRVRVSEPSFSGCGGGGGGGRYLGADFPREDGEAHAAAAEGANGGSDVDVTRQLGMLFYRILTLMREEGGGKEDERQPETSEGGLVVPARDDGGEPQRKRRLHVLADGPGPGRSPRRALR